MSNTVQILMIAGGVLTLDHLIHLHDSLSCACRTHCNYRRGSPAEVIALAASTEGFQRINPYASARSRPEDHAFWASVWRRVPGSTFDGKDGKGSQTVASR